MIAPSDTTNLKKGSLTIAGSGIASIGHITLETLSYIKEADSICYLVTDPATEAFILDNTQATCFNLRRLYGQDKDRYITYVQMCEVMLRDVRAGHTVLGIFYGHPGIFVNPSHRAIAIAREEGFEARMLPGVSAEDYMFADLGFDPATFGCAAYEASDLIYRGRRLDPTINNIIWQVGGVGVTTMAYDTAKFNLLVDHLKQDFGPDHKVVHYVGAVLPQSQAIIALFTISDLSKDDVAKQFNPSSTLYIPPRDPLGALTPMAKELGIGEREHQGRRYPRLEWLGPQFTVPPAYGPIEQEAIAEMDARELPQPDKVLRQVSPAMKKFMTDLALSPKFLKEYRDDPWDVVNTTQGLTEIERLALKLNRAAAICAVMTAAPSDATDNHGPTQEEVEGANDGGHSTYAVGVLAI